MDWKMLILGISEVIDGLVRILSLGRIHTNFSYRWLFLATKKEFRRKQQKSLRR